MHRTLRYYWRIYYTTETPETKCQPFWVCEGKGPSDTKSFNECWFLNDGQRDHMILNKDCSMSRCSNEDQDPRETVLYKCSHIGQLLHHAT